MSLSDQAFIRAYGVSTRASRTAAELPSPAQRGATPTAPASAALVDGILAGAAATSPWLETRRVDVGAEPGDWSVQPLSIDVGLESPVPAPHFARRPASAPAAQAAARAGSPPANAELGRSLGPITPHLSFGRAPKAPLSAFTASDADASANATTVGRPTYEIDAIEWPEICQTIQANYESRLSSVVDKLRQHAAEGRKVIAISGARRAEGRTTLALCLAKQLAKAQIRAAIVDAHFDSPGLAPQLNLRVDTGWELALKGDASIWDTMIESSEDRLSIVPLACSVFHDEPKPVYSIAAQFAELASNFDLVLVDAGPMLAGETAHWLTDSACGVQGVIVTHHCRAGDAVALAATCLRLASANVRQIGIAKMFTADEIAAQT